MDENQIEGLTKTLLSWFKKNSLISENCTDVFSVDLPNKPNIIDIIIALDELFKNEIISSNEEKFVETLKIRVENLNYENNRTRIIKSLQQKNINFVGEIALKSERELIHLPGLGRKSIKSIRKALEEVGLSLNMFVDPYLIRRIYD